MKLVNLQLQNFRNYSKREFKFGDQTLIIGQNGAGKSNILEAIYLLATGKSFRADRDTEMIQYNENHAIIQCQTLPAGRQVPNNEDLKVIITDRKKFEVNGVPRRMQDFVGKLKAVLFAPTDMDLITGSPGGRRRYLDFVISQFDREYRRSLVSYEKGLRQRNRLLELIRDNLAQRSQLFFWDRLLIKDGDYITLARSRYLANLSNHRYQTNYDKSVISETRLKQYELEEVAAATTLVGPHRDDFEVLYQERDISKYGSRGEQRMAMLWLKQNEITVLSDGDLPVLLLDDIFSELDHAHREEVLQIIATHKLVGGQTIMTTADDHPEISHFGSIQTLAAGN